MGEHENEADSMAFEPTGISQPMIDAFERATKDNLADLRPHPLLCVRFYYSHPSLIERIEYFQAIDNKHAKQRQKKSQQEGGEIAILLPGR